MTTIQPPFVLQGGAVTHPAILFRRALGGLLADEGIASYVPPAGKAIPGDLRVSQNSPAAMTVLVARGGAYVKGDDVADQGFYFVYNDANVTLTVPAANATNPRKDNVVARIRDNFAGVAGDTWALEYITGTPAASPTEPTLAPSALKLAVIDVAATQATVTSSDITDKRTTPPLASTLSFVGVRAFKGGTQSTPTATDTDVTYNSEDYDTSNFHDVSTNSDRFTIPTGFAGYYSIIGQAAFESNATGLRELRITVNGLDRSQQSAAAVNGRIHRINAVCQIYLNDGDIVRTTVYQNSGAGLALQSNNGNTYMAMERMGS